MRTITFATRGLQMSAGALRMWLDVQALRALNSDAGQCNTTVDATVYGNVFALSQ